MVSGKGPPSTPAGSGSGYPVSSPGEEHWIWSHAWPLQALLSLDGPRFPAFAAPWFSHEDVTGTVTRDGPGSLFSPVLLMESGSVCPALGTALSSPDPRALPRPRAPASRPGGQHACGVALPSVRA